MAGVGFIGLGNQGGPIAHRIVDAGLPLVVWARRPEVAQPYAAKGARVAATIAELGAACRHVGICVLDDAAVIQVCAALIPPMPAGGLIAVHSTILPQTAEDLARRCQAAGLHFVDAPVSGGEVAGRDGTLTIMCGAQPEAFAAARPVFETYGKVIVLLGHAGAGQRAKLVNNALLAANIAVADSALQAATALGIDRAALMELIGHCSGRSFGFEMAARRETSPLFAHGARILLKDLELLGASLPGDPAAAALDEVAGAFLRNSAAGS